MKRLMLSMATVPLLVGGLSVNASAEDGIGILNDVSVKGQIRPRYEYADIDNNGLDAGQALTSRIKLNAGANLFGVEGLNANIGLIGVYDFGWTGDNGLNQGGTTYVPSAADPALFEEVVVAPTNDKIVDPSTAMLSNLEMTYTVNKTTLHAGRGQVNLDNQRFIGTVGWRQLERSYDTVFIADNSVENLNLLAAWVYGFEGVTSTNTVDTNSVILHASYKVMPELTITAYDYMLANIHDTYGIALTGTVNAGAKITYRAEYAMQQDPTMEIHDPGEITADADYFNVDLGTNINGVILGANYEYMSGADGDTTEFTAPLGTNHKFNGWADVFLKGAGGHGLNDMNGRIGYKAKGFGKVLAVYHQFVADVDGVNANGAASDDLGSEIDFLYANKVPGVKNLNLLLKGALYSAGDITGYDKDKQVYWVQLDYKFATK